MSDIQTGISNMTRKEVVHQLKGLLFGALRTTTKERKALEYAIASLETDEAYDLMYEQPEFCADCVSRKAVCEWYCNTTCNMDYCTEPCLEHKELCELPSVLPKADAPETNVGKIESTTKNETLVSLGVYKQVAWERDIAIQQLHELGYEFGQKIEPTTKNDLGVDCISRQSVLDKIQRLIDAEQNNIDENGDYMNYARERVNAYEAIQFFVENDYLCPSVTPQEPRWIPVSEKLPNDRDWYLGIFKEPDTGWINPLPFICDYVGRETKATTKEYWILRGFTDIDEPCDYHLNLECVAWMPLPKQFELQ